MNVYLIGMMGAGKTETGRALARQAGMKFIDLDEEIERRTHQTINGIFETQGEPFFRAAEQKLLNEASGEKGTVIAPGGGIVLDPDNIARMKATGTVLYLETSFDVLWQRVREKRDRPLLKASDPKQTFLELFETRRPLYESASDGIVTTDGLSPEAVARKIAELYLR
ncbi:MAG: shikimate kinase [Candidatus Omnitrophica bacterium]|nr:shikimate kinase [Candidatus Omnitrophota bacterium]